MQDATIFHARSEVQSQEKGTSPNQARLQFCQKAVLTAVEEPRLHFKKNNRPSILRDDDLSITDPSIFTSIALVLLG